jgi:sporulation protein YlmC with PRC-barrel domain
MRASSFRTSIGTLCAIVAAAVAVLPAVAQTPAGRTSFVAVQAAGETRASKLIGVVVKNKAGETVGDINDVVFQPGGQVTVYIIGVGGVLGIGEKNVAVPYSDVTIISDPTGKRSAVLDVTKAALETAPMYVGERTTFEKVEDSASSMATAAGQKAKELKDKMTAPKDPAVK